MSTPASYPWIVFRFSPESLACLICGARVLFPIPADITLFVAGFRAWAEKHFECGSSEVKPS